MRAIRSVVIGVALVVAATPIAGAVEDVGPAETGLERALVESADSPAEHEGLARRFHAEADRLRMKALEHRSMGDAYRRSKLRGPEELRKHCDRIADLEEQIAQHFEALAAGHEEAAKR